MAEKVVKCDLDHGRGVSLAVLSADTVAAIAELRAEARASAEASRAPAG